MNSVRFSGTTVFPFADRRQADRAARKLNLKERNYKIICSIHDQYEKQRSLLWITYRFPYLDRKLQQAAKQVGLTESVYSERVLPTGWRAFHPALPLQEDLRKVRSNDASFLNAVPQNVFPFEDYLQLALEEREKQKLKWQKLLNK